MLTLFADSGAMGLAADGVKLEAVMCPVCEWRVDGDAARIVEAIQAEEWK